MTDRLVDYAVNLIKMEPDHRLDIIDLVAAEKALAHLITKARITLRAIQDKEFKQEWRDGSAERDARRRERLDDIAERRAYLKTAEGRAEVQEARKAQRSQRDAREKIDETVKKSGKSALKKIADALHLAETVDNIYETLRIGGKPIGSVHYRELYKIRTSGVFEAAMCEQIMRHARPNENLTVRQIVTGDKLVEFRGLAMVAVAESERNGIVPVADASSPTKWSWRV